MQDICGFLRVFCEKKKIRDTKLTLGTFQAFGQMYIYALGFQFGIVSIGENAHNSCVFSKVGITTGILIYHRHKHFGLRLLLALINY